MKVKRRDLLFFVVAAAFALTAWLWLLVGAGPLLAAVSSTVHDGFHARGRGDGVVAEIARNVAQAAHSATTSWQSLFDYMFSFFNLGLASVLLKLRPFDATARLLAIGMIGTSIAFNLQGHDALQVVPVGWLSAVDSWHVWVHIASGLCYMFALLLFPSGRLRSERRGIRSLPLLIPLALFFTILSRLTVDDHTLGLVLVYGLFIPIAGIAAQVRRFRRATSPEQRQQSKVLLFALLFAVLVALPLVAFTQSFGDSQAKTVTYEIAAPAAGTYFFRCDPHPDDMKGVVVVAPDAGDGTNEVIDVLAQQNRFDTSELRIKPGELTTIRFTNRDADLHNIAIYRSSRADDPIFIGQEFSGRETAAFAFRTFRIVFAVIPIALFVGLVRFHLWDIDRVVNRTLVYGALVGIITLAYLALVVGLGAFFGAGSRMSLALSIVVTVLIAATFQPLRDRARKIANRVVYGRRATPYEVLSAFSKRAGSSYALEDAIPEMAKAVGEGTGARRSEVWLRVGDQLVLSAEWPQPDEGPTPPRSVALNGGGSPDVGPRDRTVPVVHRGQFLGALTVTKPPGQALSPVEERLLDDVASQAGLVLRNAQLTAELQGRLEQLRRSRQRIVAAQDAERRRLERNIHDGAQQHLIALSMKLRLAQDLADKDPERARALLEDLQEDTGQALQTLRDLARGIYPPVLADKGLVQALEAHARRCAVDVTVTSEDVGRHGPEVEAAVYFCCLEAIQNAIKHSGGGPVAVAVRESEGRLTFRVIDQGRGFALDAASEGTGIQNMRDRVAALGGDLEVTSEPGRGTVVAGWVPVQHPVSGSSQEVETPPE